jgi:hypothetical protein
VLLDVLFEAAPVVAEPPVVLPETLAEPVEALCETLFATVMMLVLTTLVFTVLFKLALTCELGPAVLMLAEIPLPAPIAAAKAAAPEVLVTAAVTFELLLFDAAPEPAAPPVVLPETLAEPVDEPWPTELTDVKTFVFNRLVLVVALSLRATGEVGP